VCVYIHTWMKQYMSNQPALGDTWSHLACVSVSISSPDQDMTQPRRRAQVCPRARHYMYVCMYVCLYACMHVVCMYVCMLVRNVSMYIHLSLSLARALSLSLALALSLSRTHTQTHTHTTQVRKSNKNHTLAFADFRLCAEGVADELFETQ